MDRSLLKQNILKSATELFRLHGIRAVKMDDIAMSVKISKRTLYEVYDNKQELIFDVLGMSREDQSQHMKEFAQKSQNVMDVVIEFFRYSMERYSRTNPKFFEDIVKYPELLDRFDKFQADNKRSSQGFFERGVEEGYFVPTVNYELLSSISHLSLRNLRMCKDIQAYSHKEVFDSYVYVLIRGICTAKGIAVLDKFVESYVMPC